MYYFRFDSWRLLNGGLDAGKAIAALRNIWAYGSVRGVIPFYE